jgi:hypothetical protein
VVVISQGDQAIRTYDFSTDIVGAWVGDNQLEFDTVGDEVEKVLAAM